MNPEQLIIDKLRATQPWLRFIGIMVLIGAGLMALGSVALLGLGAVSLAGDDRDGAKLLLMGILYAPLSALYIYPGVLLLRAARHIRRATGGSDIVNLADSLEAQRRFWKYVGICMIVMTVAYLAVIAIAVLAGIIKAINHA